MRGSSILLLTSLLGGGGLLGACATSETTDSGSPAPEDAGADGDADADVDGDVDGDGDADEVDAGLQILVDAGPAVEACNGEDDDGDGAVDEDDPEGGLLCQTRLAGDCRIGDTRCIDGALVCVGRVPPGVETCGNPGRDDDCDGTADDIDELGGACVSDEPGICAPGTLTCDGADLVCLPDLAPRPEVCFDGIDDDCSGVADDGIVLAAETCSNRGNDDDCNGVVDDVPEVNTACLAEGEGACGQGRYRCLGQELFCQAIEEAEAERCDNAIDDDCDGEVDEADCLDQWPHHTGYGQTWFDDVATGTYDLTQATRACEEYVADTAPDGNDQCFTRSCGCGNQDECTYNLGAGAGQTRRVWFYRGEFVGQTTDNLCANGIDWD